MDFLAIVYQTSWRHAGGAPLQAMVASLKRKAGGGAQQPSAQPAKQPKPAKLKKRKVKVDAA